MGERIENATDIVRRIFTFSQLEAGDFGSREITPPILLVGFVKQGEPRNVLRDYGLRLCDVRKAVKEEIGTTRKDYTMEGILLSTRTIELLQRARSYALGRGEQLLSLPDLTYALVTEGEPLDTIWKNLNVNPHRLFGEVQKITTT